MFEGEGGGLVGGETGGEVGGAEEEGGVGVEGQGWGGRGADLEGCDWGFEIAGKGECEFLVDSESEIGGR